MSCDLRGLFFIRMIQRIQSLYLLLGILCMGGTFAMPLVWFNKTETAFYTLSNLGVSASQTEHFGDFPLAMALFIFALLSITQMVWALLSFRNLKMQKTRALLAILYIIIYYGVLGYSVYALSTSLKLGFTPNLGAILPLAAAFACFMAYRGIKRDHELIRSVDRIR